MARESSGAGRPFEREGGAPVAGPPGRPRSGRRIWSELLPLEAVRERRTLALLERYGLTLAVAVRPDTAAGLPDLVAACADAGVALAVWPMLADADGRWAGAGNAAAFGAFVGQVLDQLAARGLAAPEIVFDLEPPISLVRRALGGASGLLAALGALGAGAAAPEAGDLAFAALARGLGERGVAASAAVVPLVLLDGAERGWERLLGTPVSAAPWAHVSAMLYTSMIEGWSRGALGRRDAVSLLAWACRAAARRFGPGAGVSLGLVGKGALGDEPVYRDADELREDVAAAVAAGVDHLALFDLGGVLGRPPAEAWLEAFVARPEQSPQAPVSPTLRARCAVAAGVIVGRATPRLAAAGMLGLRRRG